MVKTPNSTPKAKAKAASSGAGGAARPSPASASGSGSAKASKFKKRKAIGAGAKVAAPAVAAADGSTSAGAAGRDEPAPASVPKPSTPSGASPATSLKPATVAEGSSAAQVLAPKPDTAEEASASTPKPKPKPKPKQADAAAATSNGAGASGSSGGSKKNRKGHKERLMAWKGKGKQEEAQGNTKGMGKEEGAQGNKKGIGKEEGTKKEGGGDSRGGGLIFMCNAQTKPECFQNRVFGMPMGKKEMVEKVRPGTKVFLYDFDLRLLYGVYKATSKGGINLIRNAFNGKFPAQVKFTTDKDCLPLPESTFKHAIKENYSASRKFDPEITSTQVRRLMALFKPITVQQSAPRGHLDGRYHHEERRHQHEDRPHPLHVEDRRPQVVVHVPAPEDSYRATHYAPFPTESRPGQFLVNVQDDHRYYQQAPPAPESQHIPLAPEARQVPLATGPHYAPSVPEPRHVPLAYYHHLAPSSDDSYYRSRVDPVHERIAARTPPRDYAAQLGELAARADHMSDLYRTTVHDARLEDPYRPGELAARGARVEELYRPGEIASRGDRVADLYQDLYRSAEAPSRGARMEDLYRPGEVAARDVRMEDPYGQGGIDARGSYGGLYRSDQLNARAVDLPHSYQTSNPAYAEASQRPVPTARANGPGAPVSSLYSFAGAPAYR
ncbi:unnamed protein product [Triticum turgidum subsp. durum]|uniref:DCD domain-containing protein n=1 Tax=Triticum turgidum subsp. durum TaxID=4567 RepID=A0A9R0ZWJ4_TRITD|nr:unnamed protein product [Triticum turgidum subsp. durum]